MTAGQRRGRRIILWRHGRTSWNRERRFQGSTDIPLDETGTAQAARSARVLAALRPDAIIASDLQRAAATGKALAELTDLPITLRPELRETFAGRWQGITWDEIEDRFGAELAAFRRGEEVRRGGDGELETEVAERSVPAVLEAADELPDGGTLVVASHGGTIRITIAALIGLHRENWSSLGGLSNCCWSVLSESDRGWRLTEHNAGSLPEPVVGDDT
ncbi:histidine phosphatase family protein [Mangrovactinospora gilvigrisea]|uniref:Histidine phosphatase family protein n=1 Tax=Mangrovactinospora gilvigrisea TaxID=1428644 RepID=A0A1J7CDT3_9ACTN|nr:histidine phosphatase family protein [Mangrovactinospora gilvigrisea]OIV37826.1 histidine phosphatase family protein [Mangrovactinospora gilvigrisea]